MKRIVFVKVSFVLFSTFFVIALSLCWKSYQKQERESHICGGACWYEGLDLNEQYWGAYSECVWIAEIEPELRKRSVNSRIVSVSVLEDSEKEMVKLFGWESREEFRKSRAEYWAFKMGYPANYYVMVYNSETDKVAGVITNGDGWKKSPWGIEKAVATDLDNTLWGTYCDCLEIIEREPDLKSLKVDDSKASVRALRENEKKKVKLFDDKYKEMFDKYTYWVYSIGESDNCCLFVCSDTYAGDVVGIIL